MSHFVITTEWTRTQDAGPETQDPEQVPRT